MSIRPMAEVTKIFFTKIFFFTKVLLRIVINPFEYHCNSTVNPTLFGGGGEKGG